MNHYFQLAAVSKGLTRSAIPDECTECGDKTITLTISEDDDEISLSFNGVTWSKSVAITEATYCENHTLSYVSNSGDCNHDRSSVTITSGYNADGICPCPGGCWPECDEASSDAVFLPGTTPGSINVEVSGIADRNCSQCDENFNGLFEASQVGGSYPCRWIRVISNPCFGYGYGVQVDVERSAGSIQWQVRLGYTPYSNGPLQQYWAQYKATILNTDPVDGFNISAITLTKWNIEYSQCYWPSTVQLYT